MLASTRQTICSFRHFILQPSTLCSFPYLGTTIVQSSFDFVANPDLDQVHYECQMLRAPGRLLTHVKSQRLRRAGGGRGPPPAPVYTPALRLCALVMLVRVYIFISIVFTSPTCAFCVSVRNAVLIPTPVRSRQEIYRCKTDSIEEWWTKPSSLSL